MRTKFVVAVFAMLLIAPGCMPYQDEYEQAMEAKEEAERMYEEAKVEAETAKGALEAEQQSVQRIYKED
ncbi:MAG: hypothetical protein WBD31_30455 [Rubripirellula sp.]